MKNAFLLALIALLFNCCTNSNNFIEYCPQYSAPFPKRSINLSKQLGDSAIIEIAIPTERTSDTINDEKIVKQKFEFDTLNLLIGYDKKTKNTLIYNWQSEDTIFHGKVSKYKGYYYLSEQKADSLFWIGAMQIDFDSITGLGFIQEQMCALDNLFLFNSQHNLISKYDSTKGLYLLKSDKRIIHEVYPELLAQFPKGRILSNKYEYSNHTWEEIEKSIDQTKNTNLYKNQVIESIFPNPASDDITIDFIEPGEHITDLVDNSGRSKIQFNTQLPSLSIPIQHYPKGLYILRVISPKNQWIETRRIVIQ